METNTLNWQAQSYNGQLVGVGGYNTPTSHNIYFGRRLIQSNGKTVLTDRLGSVRANESGETFEYLPYGDELPVRNPQDREKFGSYTRESATGLDYAVERYYASGLGRFSSPDPYSGSAISSIPGSFNRYSYVNGDPANLLDPTGLDSYCGPYGTWSGEGCYGYGGPQVDPRYDASLPTAGGPVGVMSADLTDAYNNYVNSVGGTGFLDPVLVGGGGGAIGLGSIILDGTGIAACAASVVCGAAVTAGIAAAGIAAIIISSSHPVAPVAPVPISSRKEDPAPPNPFKSPRPGGPCKFETEISGPAGSGKKLCVYSCRGYGAKYVVTCPANEACPAVDGNGYVGRLPL